MPVLRSGLGSGLAPGLPIRRDPPERNGDGSLERLAWRIAQWLTSRPRHENLTPEGAVKYGPRRWL